MISIACIKHLKEMPPAFFFFFFRRWGDGHLQSYYSSSIGRGDGHLHSSFSSLEDGEMATAILTVLPQGDGVMATSIFLFLF